MLLDGTATLTNALLVFYYGGRESSREAELRARALNFTILVQSDQIFVCNPPMLTPDIPTQITIVDISNEWAIMPSGNLTPQKT